MASWYYIHNSDKNITSTNPTLTTSTFSFGVEIGGVDCGTNTKQYKSNASSISAFRNVKQRLIFGNKNFEKVSVWCHARSSSPYGTINTWVDVTDKFTISKYPSSGIIDLQANSNFEYSSSYTYLYVAIDEDLASSYKVTNSLTNCTCNTEIKTEYEKDEEISLEFVANNGYAFKGNNIQVTTGALNNANATYSDDRKTVTLSGVLVGNLTVSVTADTVYSVSITGSLKNCTCNYSDGEIITEDKPKIILTANDGYIFDEIFSYKRGAITSHFSLNDEKTELSTIITDGFNYVLNEEYKAVKQVEKIGDFARLYNPVETELTELAKVRFQNDVDMGQYITALFKIPFELPTELITEEKRNVVLGNYDTNVSCNGLTTYNLVVNIGEITTPEKYENVYDYIDTECVLHLPYFDKIYLSNEFVIGQTLRIEYIIDLYSGNATANIYSSFTGGIVESVNGVIACNVPFVQKTNNSVVGLISNINKNIIDTAYMEVIRNRPYNIETVFGNETIDFGTIGDYNGYIEVSDVVLNSSATNEEKKEITDLLKEGVTINENN
jgi:hypothetical protein